MISFACAWSLRSRARSRTSSSRSRAYLQRNSAHAAELRRLAAGSFTSGPGSGCRCCCCSHDAAAAYCSAGAVVVSSAADSLPLSVLLSCCAFCSVRCCACGPCRPSCLSLCLLAACCLLLLLLLLSLVVDRPRASVTPRTRD